MVYPGAGIALSTGSAWGTSITDNSSNWDTAYGWGNHASAGYGVKASNNTWTGTNIFSTVNLSAAAGEKLLATDTGGNVIESTLGNGLNYDSASNTLSAKPYTATGITVDANGIGISAGNGLGNSANQLVAVVTAPLTFTTGSISMPAAATAQNGYLTSTDWNTFNGKATASWGTGSAGAPSQLMELTINGTTYNVGIYIP
jgi:hypothetical protein